MSLSDVIGGRAACAAPFAFEDILCLIPRYRTEPLNDLLNSPRICRSFEKSYEQFIKELIVLLNSSDRISQSALDESSTVEPSQTKRDFPMFKKLAIASALLTSLALSGTAAMAADEYNVSRGITAAGAPLGLHGVDPVEFIETANPVEGSAAYTAVHDGVAYYFSTEANMKTFEVNPAAYLPQNGGYCTFGVSVGKKFDGDPEFHAVIDDKLYVFLNRAIYDEFNKDRAGTISKAEDQWQNIRSTTVGDL